MQNPNHFLQRREFLSLSLKTVAAVALGSIALRETEAATFSFRNDVLQASPLSQVDGTFDSATLTGDVFKKPHDLLRRLDSYIQSRGGWPSQVSELFDAVIVGGGLAGLLSARELRDKNWVIFEQADRFGGISKSESYAGRRFGLGPAYVGVPEAGSPEAELFQELDLFKEARVEHDGEARVIFGGVGGGGIRNFWAGETDPAALACLQRIDAALRVRQANAFPEIPWTPESALSWQQTAALDRLTALDWLLAQGELHAHVREYFQLYCWSAFGGSIEEISAAQFLNFVAAETRGVMAFSGGNGRLAEALYLSLAKARPQALRAGVMVLDVVEQAQGLEVLIELPSGELKRVFTKAVVMAAPKYVARHILRRHVGAEQAAVWDALNYRAYLVANVLLRFPASVTPPSFDLFCLKGVALEQPSFGRRTDRNCTDLIFAGWSAGESSAEAVVTVYRPFPFDGARHFLMNFDVASKKRELTAEMEAWLAQLALPPHTVEGVRLTLWGHAIPLASAGLIASGALDRIAQPIGRRIVFANQDDAANPAFETCLASAQRAARQLVGII